ncbi:acyltransferase [Mucilaginibacter sp. 14171R-50]|uniref:acyltransferase family protein n=1 Tax=Mucilaginibacter sp. 14171R-50 TaxID=2703789 RepID=UPI00138C60A2|nr:acyltransferase [Mucilaginibacter sp. 14171R-50]QHS56908.1 acyltransferase [Mucilaginibacter sp. 14171R-50]
MQSHKQATADNKSPVYFSNLDSVRAIAALMVVVSHIEYHKTEYGLQQLAISLQNFGKIGVTIFFALSGFLITYLLLVEKKKYQTVSLKDFYIRRILRIWPLYFLVVIIGFFVYPAKGSSTALWLSVFFLPNLAFCLKMLPSIFDPIWSIGTEEQFYIFHPHIFKIKKPENIFNALIIITGMLIIINIAVRNFPVNTPFTRNLGLFLYYARFDNMMIGAIVATLYYNTKHHAFTFRFQKLFDWFFTRVAQWLSITAFIIFIYFYLKHEIPQGDMVMALLAALLIVNLCEPATSIFNLKSRPLQYMGKISYGIYLLHKYPLFLVFYLVKRYMNGTGVLVQNIVIYVVTLVAVVALATLSYYGYERYFLRIKARFQKVASHS